MFEDLQQPERSFSQRWFGDPAPFLIARWLWLRSLGVIFFSAFYALWFQIQGLIGPRRARHDLRAPTHPGPSLRSG